MKSVTYVEIDIPSFVITSPVITQTFRFAQDTNYLPNSINAIPSLLSVQVSPATISLGSNLGQRATVTCTFKDHRHIFASETYSSGTFWGKFRARYGLTLRGMPLRIIHGLADQSLASMDRRYFTIESIDGPNPQSSQFQIIAKDILKLADDDRAQAPVLSNGFLSSILGDTTESPVITTITLSPTGIGAEYPASGYAAIGGKEIIQFTRSGDILTITARGALGTPIQAHAASDRVQLVLRYSAQSPAAIISDLLQTYADISSTYIPISQWNSEIAAFMPNVYTGNIAEPTGVNKLISEIVEQAGLAVWWDDSVQKIMLRVLRPISTEAALFTEDNTLEASLQTREQPETRISQVWTYFGQRDPLKPVDDTDNYRSTEKTIDATAETEYGGATIKKIFGRWIPSFGRVIATRINNIQIGRFRDPPRRFNFSVWRRGADPISLGEGYRIKSWAFQNEDGTAANAPIQVTRLNAMEDKIDVEAEEFLFTQFLSGDELLNRTITIDSNVNNINLREIHDTIYPVPTTQSPALTITCIIADGVTVGSTSLANPALDIGNWPAGVNVVIDNNGRIQGIGGYGGVGFQFQAGNPGAAGGTALYTRFAISVDNSGGEIWGGGGGGGGGGSSTTFLTGGVGGGGGAGTLGGEPGVGYRGGHTNGQFGTSEAGGAGGDTGAGGIAAGAGGGPGLAGANGTNGSVYNGGAGGAAGNAVDGNSFVTYIASGDIRGSQIN